MPNKSLQPKDATTVKVVVPPKLGPDRRILIQTPDGRTISAVVPKGCASGSAILIRVPPSQQKKAPPPSKPAQRIITIKVPEGKRRKGEKFRVRLPDGRSVNATVPFHGCREFSLDTGTQSKQERQQNWHDNPLAVAPMILGPMLL
mmetsp:Transcript_14333/g.29656  ORF Transcript_14333/g.29656 Transcript_14333/m.29656 type:complete len:146 (-) Transcript_14333:1510-1947(-)